MSTKKGRLKLPAAFKEYVGSFGVKKVFVTSLDFRIARLYPIALWRSNEKFFEQFTDDPEAAEDIAFIANDMGADCEMDDQGRVLIPQELRRHLGIENQPVWLESYQGLVNIYGKDIYEERKRRAADRQAEKLIAAARRKGLSDVPCTSRSWRQRSWNTWRPAATESTWMPRQDWAALTAAIAQNADRGACDRLRPGRGIAGDGPAEYGRSGPNASAISRRAFPNSVRR